MLQLGKASIKSNRQLTKINNNKKRIKIKHKLFGPVICLVIEVERTLSAKSGVQ